MATSDTVVFCENDHTEEEIVIELERDTVQKRFDHLFALGFSVQTDAPCESADTYPEPSEIRTAIQSRLDKLSDDELVESIGVPCDTIEEEDAAKCK